MTDEDIVVDRIKGGAQVERYQKGSRTSVSCMKYIIKSECKCSFISGPVKLMSRRERIQRTSDNK